MILSDVDKRILSLLKQSKEPLSTYQIAKMADVTWPTANSHCYKLKSMNKVESKLEKSKFGSKEKVVWWAV
jgi:DNA-binding CsgD family transcriptional regulator